MVNICSAMCDSGRYESDPVAGPMPIAGIAWPAVQVRFSCESITAFGGPVVPDV